MGRIIYSYHSSFGILKDQPQLRKQLNELAFQDIKPNICFLLDIDPYTAIERTRQRGQDFFDKHNLSYHQTMRNAYLNQAYTHKWIVIDGHKSIEHIHSIILSHLHNLV